MRSFALRSIALRCGAWHCLHCIALLALYCTPLYGTVLYGTVLHGTLRYCTVLHCTVLYRTALHCTFSSNQSNSDNKLNRHLLMKERLKHSFLTLGNKSCCHGEIVSCHRFSSYLDCCYNIFCSLPRPSPQTEHHTGCVESKINNSYIFRSVDIQRYLHCTTIFSSILSVNGPL